MTNQIKSKLFLNYVGQHFDFVRKNLKLALKSKNIKYCEDFFSDILIICHDTIEKKGFAFPKDMTLSGSSFNNYLFISYKNRFYNYVEHSQKKFMDKIISFSETPVQIVDESNPIIQLRTAEAEELLIQEIFAYVELHYEGERADIYKFYFFADLSQEEVAKITGISLGKVSYTITKINEEILAVFKEKRNLIK